ncbi:MAG: hypothetical protein ACFFAE_11390 [Candidatus Hodarchaeota archaeon]
MSKEKRGKKLPLYSKYSLLEVTTWNRAVHEEKSGHNQVKTWHKEFRSVVPDSYVPINLVGIRAKNTINEL